MERNEFQQTNKKDTENDNEGQKPNYSYTKYL